MRGYFIAVGTAVAVTLGIFACSKRGNDLTNPDTQGLQDTTPPVIQGFTGAADTLRVGTLNMCVGFPVSQLVFMNMNLDSIAFPELTRLDSLYTLGKAPERVKHMAQAVAAESLDVIGLQEVMRYQKNDSLRSDFFAEFKTALEAASGVSYAAFYQPLNDTTLHAAWHGDSLTLHFAEGNALLVREGVTVLDTERVLYQNHLYVELIHAKTDRGYIYARLRTRHGAMAEVYTTHLEVFNPYQPDQARELKIRILQQKKAQHAQIILADLNAARDSTAYDVLVKEASFLDAFGDLPDSTHGTCCVADTRLWDSTATFSNERIDHVLGKAVLGVTDPRSVIPMDFVDSAGERQFATDHRLVMATWVLPIYP